jgi:hypothetical protein
MLLLKCISRILFIKSNLTPNGKEKKSCIKKEDKESKVKEAKIVSRKISERGFFFAKICYKFVTFL